MCQIPVFCWITATVLDHMLRRCQSGPLPQTLTDMYTHFLLVQTQRKRKYRSESAALEVNKRDCEVLLKLGKLAFDHLHNGNLIFYQEDLQQVGLDLTEASVYSGLCTEILIEENIIFQKSVYCFVHLSVQEFLAAVYMLRCFNHKKTEEISSFLRDWEENMPLDVFLQKSIEKSFENESGRLDLFVRFLHGLLLESNQRLLRVLLGQIQTDSQMIQKITQNLRERNAGGISAPGSITVFYCLTEMNDQTIHQRILHLLKTEFESDLSEFHCMTLAVKLQMPQEVLQELDIKRFRRMPDGKLKLVPPDTCREATILWNGLSREHAAVIASALKSLSQLKRLDLWLRDHGAVEAFCEGLRDPHCRLETLSLHHSRLSELSCHCLASALKSHPAHLRKLDLSWNEELQEPGLQQICTYLQSPDCHLHILRLENCRLGEGSCLALSSALVLNPHHLRELDVTENQLSDAGVEHFCKVLKMPHLSLEHLRLDNCGLSEVSCSSLATALSLNPKSKLKKLDLSVNEVKDSGVERLCEYLRWPHCHLEAIELKGCGLTEHSCLLLASSLNVHMKDLRLNWNPDMRDQGVKHMSMFLKSQSCGLEELRFRGCGVTGIGCSSLDSALKSTPLSPLTKLDLCENSLTQSDVEKLTELQHNPQYRLEQLEWEDD
ncbi:ribonuclease inhibitor-like [Periophthalmus magnuspinnatus]|uniref:ribonuclease inhibitor-like n=1 Tax=Periophthalmus magnuspinnatus TaxID=409849 RepID=UPI002436C8EF|nr:ribonuclease inhibitor-like [Periophthalmus magnuspinnatus]XP_055088099.1 ribonuclease inhibitor-like [Periophthalmus magnuspinnatus]